MKISIIVPVYNEEKTISSVITKLQQVSLTNNIKREIIIVNDGSNDNTDEEISQLLNQTKYKKVVYLKHGINSGKGSAIRTRLSLVTFGYVLIQDAYL